MIHDLTGLYLNNDNLITRWASPENPKGLKGGGGMKDDGRKGMPSVPLRAGETYCMAEERGVSGTIRRIWCTVSDRTPEMLRSLRLDFFWDGVKSPSFSVPFSDFFCVGVGRIKRFESILFSSPEGRSFNCFIPMPFKTGMKITITNESESDLSALYYDINYTIQDKHSSDSLHFHAYYRRENPTTIRRDYEILPKISGAGRFIGTVIGVIVDRKTYHRTWWGEGEVKMYIDGDPVFPTLCGTGTEDYIGTAWGLGEYSSLYQGCPLADHKKGHYWFYRFHLPDPVYFKKNIRVTIQQIGFLGVEPYRSDCIEYFKKHDIRLLEASEKSSELDLSSKKDYVIFERQDDWSSCAFFYLDNPVSSLQHLDEVPRRTENLLDVGDSGGLELDLGFCDYG